MTRIYTEPQLDFCDVLFQPKRTTLNSRKDAGARRQYKFKYYPEKVMSCGLIVSNMATTGTMQMAMAVTPYEVMTCFHKHIPYNELKKYFYTYEQLQFVSVGLKDDKEKFFELLESNPAIDKVCVDIANGYIPNLLKFVKELRTKFPNILIMAGNVVTGDMVQDLILSGADIVKVGIGNGCFTGHMKVQTSTGLKNIQDVRIGDKVLTHTGEYQEVTNTFQFNHHKKILKVNNIECTPNHEFYVIDRVNKDKVTEENLQDYAYWISAEKLDKTKHLLIKR